MRRKLKRADQHAQQRDAQIAKHFDERQDIDPEADGRAPEPVERCDDAIGLRDRHARLAIHLMHFREQTAKALRQFAEAGILSALAKPAYQALEQPGPERVELMHAGHVDGYAATARDLERRFIHETLEHPGMRGRP